MSEKVLKVFYIENRFVFYDPETGYTYREGKKGFNKWFEVKIQANESVIEVIQRNLKGVV